MSGKNTRLNKQLVLTALLATSFFAVPVLGRIPAVTQGFDVDDQQQITQFIEQLNDSSLTKRSEARKKLTQFGQQAIGQLTTAALSDKRELITQSIDILADMANNAEDKETADAAKIALQSLAESDKPSTADRAKLALDSEKDGGIKAFPGWDKPNSEFNGNMGGGMNRSVSVSSSNGVKTITIKENGITTVIQDLAGGKIGVQVTGGEKPVQFVANNKDELKKKDEGLFALYEQYNNGMQLRGFGNIGNMLGQTGNGNRAGAEAIAGESNVETTGGPATAMLIQHLTQMKQRFPADHPMQKMLDQQIAELVGQLNGKK